MSKHTTDFVRRFFNNDPDNGMVGIGMVCMHDVPDFLFPEHQGYYSCSLVLSGNLYLQGSASCLKRGDVLQIFPMKKNADSEYVSPLRPVYDENPDTVFFHICFGKLAYEALQSIDLLLPLPMFHTVIETYMESWMPTLTDQLKNTPQADLSEVYQNIQKFVIQFQRPLLRAADHRRQLMESAKQLISDQCLQDVSLPSIASSLGLGYENFRKIFKEEIGQSPHQYALQAKFLYAQRFLTEGKSVKETAAALGYADPYIFSKQFKKYVGKAPSYFKTKS